jgi:hypothetical protein
MTKIRELNINYNGTDNENYIIIKENNREVWYTYEIIGSYNIEKHNILWYDEMIIIPKKLRSNIKIKNKLNKYKENELEKELLKNKNEYLEIVSHISGGNYKIYLGLKKIIKT